MGLFENKLLKNWQFISNLLKINRWFFKKLLIFLLCFCLSSLDHARVLSRSIFSWKNRPITKISAIFCRFLGRFFLQSIIGGQFCFGHLQYPIFHLNIGEISQFFKPWFWHIKDSLILLYLKMGLDFSSEKK